MMDTKKLPTGGYEAEANNAFIELLIEGDPNCKYKIGDQVKKSIYEEDDLHKIDHPGVIIGCKQLLDMDVYLVQFENDDQPSLILGHKIGLL